MTPNLWIIMYVWLYTGIRHLREAKVWWSNRSVTRLLWPPQFLWTLTVTDTFGIHFMNFAKYRINHTVRESVRLRSPWPIQMPAVNCSPVKMSMYSIDLSFLQRRKMTASMTAKKGQRASRIYHLKSNCLKSAVLQSAPSWGLRPIRKPRTKRKDKDSVNVTSLFN